MKHYLFVLLLCVTCFSNAQDYKFGKVSKKELSENFNPIDSSASATYLLKYRKTFFEYDDHYKNFKLITEIHERIKIYNQKGYDYATIEIGLYKGDSKEEKVTGIKGITFNLVGDKVQNAKLKKEGVFKTERSKYYNQVKFTMPKIGIGTVIEYKYRIVSPYFYNVDEFKFQHSIPIKKVVSKFESPEYFNFKLNSKGSLSIDRTSRISNGKFSYSGEYLSKEFGKLKEKYNGEREYRINVDEYEMDNIPALKSESYVNNINNYRSSIKYELSFTKFPNAVIEYYSTTWEDVVKTIYKNPNFGSQLDKSIYYEDDIDTLISNISDPIHKMNLIFDFVKSKVKWNGYYNKYTNQGVKKAYKEQVGNVAEINLMLTSMLRYAGLNANPVLVSTRSNGIPLFPTREGYNYVISCIEVPNRVILLDATSVFNAPNILPQRTLNWEGRIIRKSGSFALISLYPNELSKNTVTMMTQLNEKGDVEGVIRTIKTAHEARNYRESYVDGGKDQYLTELESKYGGIEISDFTINNQYNLSKPVSETYKFSLKEQSDVIGDKMFVSPLFFLTTKENTFKLEEREYPIDFGYPLNNKYRISVTIPEGYIVESLPKSKIITLPENLGTYKYNITNKGKIIQLVVDSEIRESIIAPKYYAFVKEYFKQLIEKENEKIVLTKTKP